MTPANFYWDNEALNGAWEDPVNWGSENNDVLPGPGDHVSIWYGYSIVNNLANTSVASITSGSPITFNGALSIGANDSNFATTATFNGELTLAGDLVFNPNWDTLGGEFNADIHIGAGASLQLLYGDFAVAHGVTVDGDGVLTNGWLAELELAGDATFANLDQLSETSKIVGGGTLTIQNEMNFYAGSLEGGGTLEIAAGATLNIAGVEEKTILGWSIENDGTTNWTGGQITTAGVNFTNNEDATFNVGQDAYDWSAAGGSFQNEGTFNSSGQSQPFVGWNHTLAIEFNSTNLVQVLSGTLTLTQGGGFANEIAIPSASSKLTLSEGEFNLNAGLTVQGDGVLIQWGADSQVLGDVQVDHYDFRLGTLAGAGTLTIQEAMNYYDGSIEGGGTLEIAAEATLNILEYGDKNILGWTIDNWGATHWTGGNIITEGVVFTNKEDATFDLGQYAQDWTAAGGSFQNDGTFTSSGGDHTMTIVFVSTNVVNVLAGTLTLTEGGEFLGQATANAAASLVLGAGVFDLQPGFVFTGTGFLVTAGSNTFVFGQVVATNYELRTGALTGDGDLIITDTMNWLGGTMESGEIESVTRIQNGATMNLGVDNGQFNPVQTVRNLEIFGTLNWRASGTWDLRFAEVRNYNSIQVSASVGTNLTGSGSLLNSGQLTYNSPANTIFLLSVVNNGTIRLAASGGVLNLDARDNWECHGPMIADASTEVRFRTGTFNFIPDIATGDVMGGAGWFVVPAQAASQIVAHDDLHTIANNFRLESGTVRGTGTFGAHVLLWTGGRMTEAGVTLVASGDQLTIDGSVTLETRAIRIHGSAGWQNTLNPFQSSTITLSTGGTIDIDGGSFSVLQSGGTLSNNDGSAGLFVKNSGTLEKGYTESPGVTVFEIKIDNNAGNVRFFGDASVQGTYTQQSASSVLDLGSGQYTFSFAFSLADGAMTLAGGRLVMAGGGANKNANNATIIWNGTVVGSMQVRDSRFDLTGDLVADGGQLNLSGNALRGYLHGFTLGIIGGASINLFSGIIYKQGGNADAITNLGGQILDNP